ncbi:MAG TPA: hypothetical protein ENN81_12725 [Phycisphaerales bacterium]|nr:hypothetical protein [Phycisphaerales bacterium]
MIQDGRGEYEPGQWMVHYDPVSRILTVAITIQKLRVEVAENIVVGGSHDTFVGEVPPAGQAWHAVWTSFPKYQASTDGGQTFVPLEAPDEYGLEQNVIFEKIVESNP